MWVPSFGSTCVSKSLLLGYVPSRIDSGTIYQCCGQSVLSFCSASPGPDPARSRAPCARQSAHPPKPSFRISRGPPALRSTAIFAESGRTMDTRHGGVDETTKIHLHLTLHSSLPSTEFPIEVAVTSWHQDCASGCTSDNDNVS